MSHVLVCEVCTNEFESMRANKMTCSYTCSRKRLAQRKHISIAALDNSDVRENVQHRNRGAWAEALAISWLMTHGYDVFTNVSAHGPIDLITYKEKAVTLVDVKTTQKQGGRRILTPEQESIGVRLLLVTPDGAVAWAAAPVG